MLDGVDSKRLAALCLRVTVFFVVELIPAMAADLRRGKRRRAAVGEIGEALQDRGPLFCTTPPSPTLNM